MMLEIMYSLKNLVKQMYSLGVETFKCTATFFFYFSKCQDFPQWF